MSGFEQLFPGSLPRLVMFDLDGTLIDSVPDLAAAVDNMLLKLGRQPAGIESVREWVGNGVQMLVRRALVNNIDAEGVDEARIRGVELQLGSELLGWEWNANYSLMSAENRSQRSSRGGIAYPSRLYATSSSRTGLGCGRCCCSNRRLVSRFLLLRDCLDGLRGLRDKVCSLGWWNLCKTCGLLALRTNALQSFAQIGWRWQGQWLAGCGACAALLLVCQPARRGCAALVWHFACIHINDVALVRDAWAGLA